MIVDELCLCTYIYSYCMYLHDVKNNKNKFEFSVRIIFWHEISDVIYRCDYCNTVYTFFNEFQLIFCNLCDFYRVNNMTHFFMTFLHIWIWIWSYITLSIIYSISHDEYASFSLSNSIYNSFLKKVVFLFFDTHKITLLFNFQFFIFYFLFFRIIFRIFSLRRSYTGSNVTLYISFLYRN